MIMRSVPLATVFSVACIISAFSGEAYACHCASSFRGQNSWETAKLEAASAAAIFEGVPEHVEMKWDVLTAKNGDLISADTSSWGVSSRPHMTVTFRVQRAYRGNLGSEVQIDTGLGGGDCGAGFNTGLTSLVYAYGPDLDHLAVSMCSPGGWIGDSDQETRLRFLRKEHPTASDLLLRHRWIGPGTQRDRERRQHIFNEREKRYASATGQICGNIIPTSAKGSLTGRISFLPTVGYSPFNSVTEEVKEDGSFCSRPLGPGKYYVYFEGGFDEKKAADVFYPGVNDRMAAAGIEVAANRTESITFNVPMQKAYSVVGLVSTDDKSGLGSNDLSVALLSPDGRIRYRQSVSFEGFLPLPKTKYFHLENVLPGHYIALVLADRGGYTKKQEVDVATHMKMISLVLLHKK